MPPPRCCLRPRSGSRQTRMPATRAGRRPFQAPSHPPRATQLSLRQRQERCTRYGTDSTWPSPWTLPRSWRRAPPLRRLARPRRISRRLVPVEESPLWIAVRQEHLPQGFPALSASESLSPRLTPAFRGPTDFQASVLADGALWCRSVERLLPTTRPRGVEPYAPKPLPEVTIELAARQRCAAEPCAAGRMLVRAPGSASNDCRDRERSTRSRPVSSQTPARQAEPSLAKVRRFLPACGWRAGRSGRHRRLRCPRDRARRRRCRQATRGAPQQGRATDGEALRRFQQAADQEA